MVKYFVLQSAKANGQYANALYAYDTLDEAKKAYHEFMAYQILAEGVTYAMAAVTDASGNQLQHEVWYATEQEA